MKLREFCFVRLRKAPRRVAGNLNALDSSQLRCKQLLTPDITRRYKFIVSLLRERCSALRARGGLHCINSVYKNVLVNSLFLIVNFNHSDLKSILTDVK